jgi:hypothetical protein
MKYKYIFTWSIRFAALLILFYILFLSGTLAVAGLLPDVKSEPGLLPNSIGLFVIGICNTLLVMGLILSSSRNGWKLSLGLSFAYYGAVTFLTQIETWYFLSKMTVDEKLLGRLFIMGLPVAFIYIPLAVWILGKTRAVENSKPGAALVMPVSQWAWKLIVIALVYLVLYWSAGYFIAWQNPSLRAFYGSPGAIVPFWQHTVNMLSANPGFFPFQILRAMLWTLCAYPIISGSKMNIVQTAVLLGLFFTIPQCLGLLLENPIMPDAGVRLSHLIELSASNFVFAVIIAWLLHREHKSVPDLFGINHNNKSIEIQNTIQ